jgi:hypothetical protein
MKAALLLLLVVLPRPALAQQTRGRCSVPSIDSAFARSGPVYRDCEVDRPARLRRDVRPVYTFPEGPRPAVAELVFVVDTAGIPDTLTAMIDYTDTPDYATLLLQTLARWRYRPAERRGEPVRQLVRERRAACGDGRVPFVVAGQPPPRQQPQPCR